MLQRLGKNLKCIVSFYPHKNCIALFLFVGIIASQVFKLSLLCDLEQELCKPQAQIALLAGSYWVLKTGVTKEILEDSKIELLQFVGLLFLFMLLQYCQLIAPSKSFNTQGNSLWPHKSSFISIWAMSPTE